MTPRPSARFVTPLTVSTLLLAVAWVAAPGASAQTEPPQPHPPRTLKAYRISGTPPVADGRLDEACWREAEAATDFVQREPSPGKLAAFPTEARIAYDDDFIYVGMRLYDPAPDSIRSQLARRDFSGVSDWAHVLIDSYHDHRTAFRFSVNPHGVEKDVIHTNDVTEDITWDAVWHAGTQIDSLGWTAEYKIPLSQIRFSSSAGVAGAGQVWGLNFLRQVARRTELAWWAPIPPNSPGVVSMFGELTDIRGLEAPRRLEVLPYTVARLTRAPRPDDPADPLDDSPFYDQNDLFGSLGGDIKYGVTSDLTLNATLNPDFGQVEADPSQVNLSAFETFFPEKRPFFLEGADIFRVRGNFPYFVRGNGFGNDQLFYSRRVGRRPQGGVPESAEHFDFPDASSITAAAKLSGKTRSGWSIGVLDALTEDEHVRYIDGSGNRRESPVEPLSNFMVARAIKDFNKGRTAFGAIVTSTNRKLDGTELDFLRSAAYTGGLDARHRFWEGNYELRAALLGSHIRGSENAIARVQSGPGHYFQRPDDKGDYLEFDPSRTSLGGALADLKVEKIGGGHWNGGLYGHMRTPGFETNDLGFMRSTDWILQGSWLGYNVSEPGKTFRQWNLNGNQWVGYSFGGEHRTTGLNTNGWWQFRNYMSTNISIDHELPSLSLEALRGGPALKVPTGTNIYTNFFTDNRPAVNGGIEFVTFTEPESKSLTREVYLPLNVRPSSRIQLSLTPGMVWTTNTWQFADIRGTAGDPEYLFGRLEQKTALLTARMNYTFTPDISLQFYAQPFISAGDFSEFREVADPRADAFDDRFRLLSEAEAPGAEDYDFNVKEFRSNLVLRWEYRPGSAMFLVWSQGRSAFAPNGRFNLGDDTRELFRVDGTDILLLKVSYWLDV
jgi:hypothetical protein